MQPTNSPFNPSTGSLIVDTFTDFILKALGQLHQNIQKVIDGITFNTILSNVICTGHLCIWMLPSLFKFVDVAIYFTILFGKRIMRKTFKYLPGNGKGV